MANIPVTLITWTDLPYEKAVSELMAAIDDLTSPMGEVIFQELQNVKIRYNLETGHTAILAVKESPFVQVHFAKKNFPFMITFVKDAICLVAKKHLLIFLYTLNDEEISDYIREYHGEKDKLRNLTLVDVDNTLNTIANAITPIFTIPFFHFFYSGKRSSNPIVEIVAEQLKKTGIRHIRSHEHVKEIEDAIQEKLKKLAKITSKPSLTR